EIHGHWCEHSLRRIVENLCGNAVKYGDPHHAIIIILKKDHSQVSLEIHNEGPPISPQDQAHLFQAFQRFESSVKGGAKGWGLGLVLVKGLVESHGGKIQVQSLPNKGTTFTVILPLHAMAKIPT